jgi:hypothetical protein
MGQRRDPRCAKGKAHRAEPGEIGGAGKIAVAGRGGSGRRHQLGGEIHALADAEDFSTLAHQHAHAR